MKIQYASDLHIEFEVNQQFLNKHPLSNIGDILILAGDIVPLAAIEKFKPYFKYLGDRYEQVYWIPGNHEYYHFDISLKGDSFHELLFSNVHLLNNTSIELNGVDLIFSPLWTNISPIRSWNIQNGLNDFHLT
ncbi:MAG: metallophosphoesterase, partial [Bacteroidales bacterium]|nr:metallophosphoesterase [Bacteroidales bacterium]